SEPLEEAHLAGLPTRLLDALPPCRSLRILARLDHAAGYLPGPLVAEEAVPPQQEHAPRRVRHDDARRVGCLDRVVLVARPTGDLDVDEGQGHPRAGVHLAAAVDVPTHRRTLGL